MLRLREEQIGSSDIRVEHRDVLIRLRAMIEDDLAPRERVEARPGARKDLRASARPRAGSRNFVATRTGCERLRFNLDKTWTLFAPVHAFSRHFSRLRTRFVRAIRA
jgi:hypothetical protein